MDEIKLTSYPEGFMKVVKNLDFLPEEARAEFLSGCMIFIMMETA